MQVTRLQCSYVVLCVQYDRQFVHEYRVRGTQVPRWVYAPGNMIELSRKVTKRGFALRAHSNGELYDTFGSQIYHSSSMSIEP